MNIVHEDTKKERKEKCRDFTYISKADKISLVCHTKQTKKDEKSKTKKSDEQLSPVMVIKIREIRPKEGVIWEDLGALTTARSREF